VRVRSLARVLYTCTYGRVGSEPLHGSRGSSCKGRNLAGTVHISSGDIPSEPGLS